MYLSPTPKLIILSVLADYYGISLHISKHRYFCVIVKCVIYKAYITLIDDHSNRFMRKMGLRADYAKVTDLGNVEFQVKKKSNKKEPHKQILKGLLTSDSGNASFCSLILYAVLPSHW